MYGGVCRECPSVESGVSHFVVLGRYIYLVNYIVHRYFSQSFHESEAG